MNSLITAEYAALDTKETGIAAKIGKLSILIEFPNFRIDWTALLSH